MKNLTIASSILLSVMFAANVTAIGFSAADAHGVFCTVVSAVDGMYLLGLVLVGVDGWFPKQTSETPSPTA